MSNLISSLFAFVVCEGHHTQVHVSSSIFMTDFPQPGRSISGRYQAFDNCDHNTPFSGPLYCYFTLMLLVQTVTSVNLTLTSEMLSGERACHQNSQRVQSLVLEASGLVAQDD